MYNVSDSVEKGEPGTDSYSTGKVLKVLEDGAYVVGWFCGDVTVAYSEELRLFSAKSLQFHFTSSGWGK